ncbi:DUF4142 domain-containing protein [Hyphomonas oceanitis]|uniref:DUF4142 domain-containing protein n=1 Tax=Hyphomonas oceanitis TaxID=81033 RepID=UPI003003943D
MTDDNHQNHTGIRREIDKAQDAVGAAVGQASAKLGGGTTQGFTKNALLGGAYEIDSSNYVLEQSGDAAVKTFAREMVDDHEKSKRELLAILQEDPDLERPSDDLDERRRGMIDNLKNAPENELEGTYLKQQLAAHKEAIELFKHYAKEGDNERLKRYAMSTLAVLEQHLRRVTQLQEVRA